LMRCLAAAGPASERPMAESVAQPTVAAAATRSASVLAWLSRSRCATVRTQPTMAAGDMAVPPPGAGDGDAWHAPFTHTTLRQEPAPRSRPHQTGDDSGGAANRPFQLWEVSTASPQMQAIARTGGGFKFGGGNFGFGGGGFNFSGGSNFGGGFG